MTTVVFDPGSGQPGVTIDFETADPLALAQQIAAALGASSTATLQVLTTSESISSGASVIAVPTALSDTVIGSGSQGVVGSVGGLTYSNTTSGQVAVALDGGDNALTFGAGVSATVATGGGNDTVTAAGTGYLDVGAGSNVVSLTGGASDTIVAAGTGDQISLGSASALVYESGSGAVITGGSGTQDIQDSGRGDTVSGGSGAVTVAGGVNGYYNLSADTSVYFSGGSGDAETLYGGGRDQVYTDGSQLDYYASSSASSDTVTANTGDTATVHGASNVIVNLAGGGNFYGVAGGTGGWLNGAGTTGTNTFVDENGSSAVLLAGSGTTTFDISGGSDTLVGGSGASTFDYTIGTATGSELISNFTGSDHIEVTGGSVTSQMLSNGNDVITLSDSSTLTVLGQSTLLPDSAFIACYAAGTRLATARGERPVESLRIGECVQTAGGALRPIRWIGRRAYAGRFAQGSQVRPIRVRAGALADGVPRRDLWVSPNHALYLEGVLVPAAALVNGASIEQPEGIRSIEYFHVELDSHDVLIAEGAPAESFLDDDSRMMFHNAAEYARLYPDAPVPEPLYCAPRVEEGMELERIRQRLARRAGDAIRRTGAR